MKISRPLHWVSQEREQHSVIRLRLLQLMACRPTPYCTASKRSSLVCLTQQLLSAHPRGFRGRPSENTVPTDLDKVSANILEGGASISWTTPPDKRYGIPVYIGILRGI